MLLEEEEGTLDVTEPVVVAEAIAETSDAREERTDEAEDETDEMPVALAVADVEEPLVIGIGIMAVPEVEAEKEVETGAAAEAKELEEDRSVAVVAEVSVVRGRGMMAVPEVDVDSLKDPELIDAVTEAATSVPVAVAVAESVTPDATEDSTDEIEAVKDAELSDPVWDASTSELVAVGDAESETPDATEERADEIDATTDETPESPEVGRSVTLAKAEVSVVIGIGMIAVPDVEAENTVEAVTVCESSAAEPVAVGAASDATEERTDEIEATMDEALKSPEVGRSVTLARAEVSTVTGIGMIAVPDVEAEKAVEVGTVSEGELAGAV